MTLLYSPPRTPRYNGAIEAAIGALKLRLDLVRQRAGRAPGTLLADDLAAAIAHGNELCRPHGPSAPTPAAAWSARVPVSAAERAVFLATVARCRADALAARAARARLSQIPGSDCHPSAVTSLEPLTDPLAAQTPGEYNHRRESALGRLTIRRAMHEHGILETRRR